MTTIPADQGTESTNLKALMTHERWIEVGRIAVTGLIAFLFWRDWVPVEVLWIAIAIGLYPLVVDANRKLTIS